MSRHRRRVVLRILIAKLALELERTADPADRQRIEETIRQLEDELRSIPE
jgi:hypothetical protein